MPKRISHAGSRDQSAAARSSSSRAWLRRIPWTALLISTAVLITSAFAVPPIRNAASPEEITVTYLTRPLGYIAIAPLSNVLDTLTLLSLRQHIALVAGAIVLFVAWRAKRAWFNRESTGWRAHVLAAGVFALGLGAAYVAAAILPRPMAQLVTDYTSVARVDFHTHSSASHDGRRGWDEGAVRAWHRDAGFDVAYLTDHGSVAAAERAIVRNPRIAAEGTMLLQGIEVTWQGEHVAILGAQRLYKGLLTENQRDVDEENLGLASLVAGREPIVIWNHPRQLDRLPVSDTALARVRAIEIINGSPKDRDKLQPNRAAIIAMAQRHNLALTGGSDNHGWGRATPAWTLVNVPGWRGLSSDDLATAIERAMRVNGYGSTVVAERRIADPGASTFALALSVLAVPARMLTTLSNDERISWLIWTWLIASVLWWLGRARPGRIS